MGRIIGIDLGTTSSRVAVLEGREARLIPDAVGRRHTPSVVALSEEGSWLVGAPALSHLVASPESTVPVVKRFIGRRLGTSEVEKCREALPCEIVGEANEDVRVRLRGEDRTFTELAAVILRKLARIAEDYLAEEVRDAVIAVPAFFNDRQRQAILDASRIAGLTVARLINDPTAAGLAYGLERAKDEKIAIADFGGGGFDISILELGDGIFQVRSTCGDTSLGGRDLDDRVVKFLCEELEKSSGARIEGDRPAMQRVREAAERARRELSTASVAEVNLPFLVSDRTGAKHMSVRLPRAKLEELTEDLIARTAACCRAAIQEAGVRPEDLDAVVLVGGLAHMPRARETLRGIFGRDPARLADPGDLVARGAAIQAGVLSGEVRDVLILDVTPFTLGIETQGGVFTRLIEKNTTIPTRKGRVFSTTVDNQSTVEIHVSQGEAELASNNSSLGEFKLEGIPAAPRGIPQIEVAFDIDANGIVNVSARDLGTGLAQSVRGTAADRLNEPEILKIMEATREKEETSRKVQAVGPARSNLEGFLYTMERHLKRVRAVHPEDTPRWEKELKKARALLDSQETQAEEMLEVIGALAGLYWATFVGERTPEKPAGAATGSTTGGPGPGAG